MKKSLNRFSYYIKDGKFVKEEAPANSAGGGQVAGIGVGSDGEPGVPKKKRKKVDITKVLKRAGLDK